MSDVFFFSSRRRHTRCSRDWSSDVCSSDLVSAEHTMIFLEHNKRITEVATSPLSARQLRELGEKHGFEVEVVADCYVVDTPEGPRPYFYQVLYRRGGQW